MDYPTVANPGEHFAVGRVRGHAYTYTVDGAWRVEHCVAGRWGACPLTVVGDDKRSVGRAVRKHLARRPHGFEYPQLLAGTHHGGGGHKVNGEWRKAPKRGATR